LRPDWFRLRDWPWFCTMCRRIWRFEFRCR